MKYRFQFIFLSCFLISPFAVADSGFLHALKANPMIPGMLGLGFIMWFIFIGLPFLKKARRFVKAVSGKIYLNKSASILQTQYRKLALGAIYSEQQTAYINSLTTGLDATMIRSRLSEWWGIESRQDALDTLDYLSEKGFRFYTDAVLAAYAAPEEQQAEILEKHFTQDQDLNKAWSQLQNLKETYTELQSDNIISNLVDIKKLGTVGWDCGRLVFVARLCFDSKYITEAETWNYIEKAEQLSANEFSSWETYAKSYVIGRALWGGKNSFNSGIAEIANYLLREPRSPWVQLKW